MNKNFHYIITSGNRYIDIDALACGIALHELLTLQGYKASLKLSAPLNATVTQTIRSWPLNLHTPDLTNQTENRFILVDVSDPQYFDSCVDLSQIASIYDHHYGFDSFWQNQTSVQTVIEPIGACATLIWREWKKANLESKVSLLSANLLSIAILSNSLCFKSLLSTSEDQSVYHELQSFCNLPSAWVNDYFSEQDREKIENVLESLMSDTKEFKLGEKNYAIGQIEFFTLGNSLQNCLKSTSQYFYRLPEKDHMFVNIVSINENKSYISCAKERDLALLLKVCADLTPVALGLIIELPHAVLRKDILQRLYQS